MPDLPDHSLDKGENWETPVKPGAPDEQPKPKTLHTHHYSHCPHCGEWLAGKTTCPACGRNVIDAPAGQTQQPAPKPYPIGDWTGFCPFHPAARPGLPASGPIVRNTCDPENCAVGAREPTECSFRSIARSLHSLYMWNCDSTTGDTILRQLIKELSDRLGAILQTLAGSHQALPGLEKHLREAIVQDGLAPVERQLANISEHLERLGPPLRRTCPG